MPLLANALKLAVPKRSFQWKRSTALDTTSMVSGTVPESTGSEPARHLAASYQPRPFVHPPGVALTEETR